MPLAVAYHDLCLVSSVRGGRLYRLPGHSFQGIILGLPCRFLLDCADTSVIRTSSRQELLYPRSKIAVVAKAFGLEAIDMVCDATLSLSLT